MSGAASVYRYYDATGILLYVGITARGMARNVEHDRSKPWWRYVTGQQVEHYASRSEAETRERELIHAHRPPFNVQHNPDHAVGRAVYEAFADAIVLDPVALARELNLTLPLVPDGMGFRTLPQHAAIATRLGPHKGAKVCGPTGVRVGHLGSIEIIGPIAIIPASIRRTVRYSTASARLKQVPLKGSVIQFEIRHVGIVP